jgi:hypothetical protein
MRLAIPNAPRKVSLRQVPGALLRLWVVAVFGVILAGAISWASVRAGSYASTEQAFFADAVEVPAKVTQVLLPPFNQRSGGLARLSVIYQWPEGVDRSATAIVTSAEFAEGIGVGADVKLLLSPRDPDHPREGGYERDREGLHRFVPVGVGLGVLLALGWFGFELKRAVQRELAPLRNGMIVWLTPDSELPETKAETKFPASYYRQDVKIAVTARARPGRAPVRNGEKLLAAVVPSQPTWVRVIDEDLAHHLGWFINS